MVSALASMYSTSHIVGGVGSCGGAQDFSARGRTILEASALTVIALATILAVIVGYGGLEGGEGPWL